MPTVRHQRHPPSPQPPADPRHAAGGTPVSSARSTPGRSWRRGAIPPAPPTPVNDPGRVRRRPRPPRWLLGPLLVAVLAASGSSSSNLVGGEELLLGPDDEVSSNHQHGQARQATATPTTKPNTQTLAVATVGRGTLTSRPPGIACPPRCRHAFPAATLVRLLARPATGWHLRSWGLACTGPARCTVRMRGPRRACARFVADTAALGAAVARYLRARTSRVGIAVYDATTATTYAVNQAAKFQTASIVKAQILGAVLHQAQAQRRPLTPVERANLAAMIQRSDNHAATTLWHLLGGASGVAAFDRLVPMPATTPHPAWGLTTTTAADNVRLLRAFAFPTATLTPRHRADGLSLLEHVVREQRWGVAAGVAPTAVVALKNGWLPLADAARWRVNSIGWVRGERRNYVVAVLTDHNPSMRYGIDTIQQLSRMLWNRLGSSPNLTQRRRP
jgi:beta-lactamase class A